MAIFASATWNSLPSHMTDMSMSLSSFRKLGLLKTLLFRWLLWFVSGLCQRGAFGTFNLRLICAFNFCLIQRLTSHISLVITFDSLVSILLNVHALEVVNTVSTCAHCRWQQYRLAQDFPADPPKCRSRSSSRRWVTARRARRAGRHQIQTECVGCGRSSLELHHYIAWPERANFRSTTE